MKDNLTRRTFVKSSAVAATAAAFAPAAWASAAGRRGVESINVGVIGCGGRGTGAAVNALEAHPATRIVALADIFADRVDGCYAHLIDQANFKGRVEVPEEQRFSGFDAYQKLLAIKDINYVVLATPPHFRPIHFEAAINAGKHVFMEKPVAVDPTGVRRVIDASKAADEKGLSVVAGTQRRHQAPYLEMMDRIHNGAIGDVVSASCYWNQGGLWDHARRPEYSDMEWQIRNWLYFTWLSGDHICEQHIHNIDVCNWAFGGPPLKAMGMGGRQVRTDPKYGHIFDHFAIEFEYEGGRKMLSMCRQIDGCAARVSEFIQGSRGQASTETGTGVITGENAWKFQGRATNPYVVEHADLINAMTSGNPLNEGKRVAESTLTAIMGRMSAYSGQEITFEQAMKSTLDLSPPAYEFGPLPVAPVAVPGKTRFS
ncbi:MAG: gfo/Idh/MocA family oxidoreductase [Leptolyngbya sp. PLA3]|nr:MAG: gfo/Idh/MocA family oxidoreductase [Cyanobacteria bacterium CYA]MCE7967540.1 gfo/Idh/MocA family oxidoreductase [Leptolyngbya sp. PL-A3]